jgi:hypothetical protein
VTLILVAGLGRQVVCAGTAPQLSAAGPVPARLAWPR